ncbi:MAG: hypothetical protein IKZ34_01265 [Alphaproteobacteria bacterium]|jgi:hypothetical protein|nr:hypothetical protein [Alphaproteobacteria bacterium]
MNETNTLQQIRDLEQKIKFANNKVAELIAKREQRDISLSFNAVGSTEAIVEDEAEIEIWINKAMTLGQQVADLCKQVPVR